MGLGVLGGGLSTAKWLVQQGVHLTITDLKNKKSLAVSLRSLGTIKKNIKFVLGQHRKKDFEKNDIVIVNPGVAYNNKFLKLAKKKKKIILNELGLFTLAHPDIKSLAITGTRGKTTTTAWLYYLVTQQFPQVFLAGNNPQKPLLATKVKIRDSMIVLETPSFLLENLPPGLFRPKVAIVTNIYRDHLNRYQNFQHYVKTKAEIFAYQNDSDFLILNKDNARTDYLLKLKPHAQILFFSTKKKLPEGAFIQNGRIVLRLNGRKNDLGSAKHFSQRWGQHNLENLLAASLGALVMGVASAKIKKALTHLPNIEMRQQLIYKKILTAIYNDSAATSPEATTAAVQRFSKTKDKLILIAGGTDANLSYDLAWAKIICSAVKKENLIMLEGSATKKMLKVMPYKNVKVFKTLKECLVEVKSLADRKTIILFSPGAKSFEKFKNEFDRGQQFNKLVYEYFK